MRIRTAVAVTALAAAAVLGASGTALAHDDADYGSQSAYGYENLGGPAGITKAGAFHSEGDHDNGWAAGFRYENLGGPSGITKASGWSEGDHDGQFGDNH
ncbi:hypothetical protein ACIREE_08325 [Streptomyces sp. NPDC102467]|uniref:hypothetical protein n=1 Tax=Streptomyces sp. NPDC102467 TaxID=3366179 RepID=UPI0038178C46